MSDYLHSVFPPRPSEGLQRSGGTVTPSNEADLPVPGFIYIGTYGDVRLTLLNDPVDHPGQVYRDAFGWQPLVVRKVWATDTLATNIVVAV